MSAISNILLVCLGVRHQSNKKGRGSRLRLAVSVIDDVKEPVGQECISNLGRQQSTVLRPLEPS